MSPEHWVFTYAVVLIILCSIGCEYLAVKRGE